MLVVGIVVGSPCEPDWAFVDLPKVNYTIRLFGFYY